MHLENFISTTPQSRKSAWSPGCGSFYLYRPLLSFQPFCWFRIEPAKNLHIRSFQHRTSRLDRNPSQIRRRTTLSPFFLSLLWLSSSLLLSSSLRLFISSLFSWETFSLSFIWCSRGVHCWREVLISSAARSRCHLQCQSPSCSAWSGRLDFASRSSDLPSPPSKAHRSHSVFLFRQSNFWSWSSQCSRLQMVWYHPNCRWRIQLRLGQSIYNGKRSIFILTESR